MYSVETIRKVLKRAEEASAKYQEAPVESIKSCISKGNRKIGRVMNVSLMPILTCSNCSECQKYCYDIKACAQYPNTVIDARIRNTALLQRDREEYFRRIEEAIRRRRKNKFFRWHVAGDIVDADYLRRMCEIAERHPDFHFWTYTKNYRVVNNYAGEIPGNLVIMFSEWRGMEMENPNGHPEFRVVFKGEEKPQGYYCPGNCDICKELHRGCIAGETTYCMEH